MLTINREGSVSKTSDTWWKYRYLLPILAPKSQVSTVLILGIGIMPIPRLKYLDFVTLMIEIHITLIIVIYFVTS